MEFVGAPWSSPVGSAPGGQQSISGGEGLEGHDIRGPGILSVAAVAPLLVADSRESSVRGHLSQ
jgi:hypothetical protein